LTLFRNVVEYREGIVQALIHRCFWTSTKRYQSDLLTEYHGSPHSAQQQFLEKYENKIRYERDGGGRRGGSVLEQPRPRGSFFLSSVKECLAQHRSSSSSSTTTSSSSSSSSITSAQQHDIAHVSMCLLEHLVYHYPETQPVLLTSLMDRLHSSSAAPSVSLSSPSSSSSSGSQSHNRRSKKDYDATLLLLPSPLILHR
jgi:hypothetical protein